MRSFHPTYLVVALFCLACIAHANDETAVTCGSVIKIQHQETGYYLNSEEKQLNSGSGQQLVTFIKSPSSHNTLWWVRPADHNFESEYPQTASCQLAEPIVCGATIRLTHLDTKVNLHSHNSQSPLSRQQEVTGYGTGDGRGDGGDNWKVLCSGKTWRREQPIKLYHVDTGKYLATSKKMEFNENTCGHSCPIMNHLESFGRAKEDAYAVFKVIQGVHLSK